MINSTDELETTLEQMHRIIRALETSKRELLSQNPRLFAVMAESDLDQLDELAKEVRGFIRKRSRPGRIVRREKKSLSRR